MYLIHSTMSGLGMGQPCTFANLTLFPLLRANPRKPDYITLREAVAKNTARIREVTEGGNVPELLFDNKGQRPVLILDGEELLGAKQNRTANVTILAPGKSSLRIPVTCVEAGRWRYTTDDFAPSQQMHFSEGRKRKMASVSLHRRQTGQPTADQSEVWEDIAVKCSSMGVDAPTSAMSSFYDSHRERIDDYVDAIKPQAGQVGAVFAIGDKIEGMELFDSDQTCAEMLPKLVNSYAIDAIETIASHKRSPDSAAAQAFMRQVAETDVETYPAIGLGTEIRLTAPGVVAGGLVAEERIVHLAAFASTANPQRNEANSGSSARSSGFFSRFRDRRRRKAG